jgi:hypothetical protein
MGYRLLGMAVWKTLRFLVRRELRGSSAGDRAKLAAGLTVVVAVFVFVLSRKEGDGS